MSWAGHSAIATPRPSGGRRKLVRFTPRLPAERVQP